MEGKGQIFFFGRPGCLKQSIPIRVNEEEEVEKKNDDSIALGDKNETQTHTSDDTDGNELMKRISEVLEDEPGISQNHNDKSNDLKPTENSGNISPVNNDDHKENKDNMISALETLRENDECVVELNESVNSEAINNNDKEENVSNNDELNTESCQEKHDENLVNSGENSKSEEKINDNQTPPLIEDVPKDIENDILEASESIEESIQENESEIVNSSISDVPEILETKSVESEEKFEEASTSEVSEKFEDTQNALEIENSNQTTNIEEKPEEVLAPKSPETEEKSEEITITKSPEVEEISEETVPTTELNESSEEISASVKEDQEKLSESMIDNNDNSEPTELHEKESIVPEILQETAESESQIISTEPSETQETIPEVEISLPVEEPCIPEKCDTESNQTDVEVINSNLPQTSTMTQLQTEEIESPETIEPSENTQNKPSESTSITEVLDSNKIEDSNVEVSAELCESSRQETFESEIKDVLPSDLNETETIETENIKDSEIPNENVLNDEIQATSSEKLVTPQVLAEPDKSLENEDKNTTSDFKLVTYDESSSEDATIPSIDDNNSETYPTNDDKITSEIIETPMDISCEKSDEEIHETESEKIIEIPLSNEPQSSLNFIEQTPSETTAIYIEERSPEITEKKLEIVQNINAENLEITVQEKSEIEGGTSTVEETPIEVIKDQEMSSENVEEPDQIEHLNATEKPHDIQEQSLETSQPNKTDVDETSSIASIEEQRGIEISEPKCEDISIAEEALPKDEIYTTSSITQQPEEIPEISTAQKSPSEIENEILPQENIEEIHPEETSTEVNETLPVHEKSPEISIEDENASEQIESESRVEELQAKEIISERIDEKVEENCIEEKSNGPIEIEDSSKNVEPSEPDQANFVAQSSSVKEVPSETQIESEVKDLSQKEPINSEIQKESVEAPQLAQSSSVDEVPSETQIESEVKDLSQKEPINSEIQKESVEAPQLAQSSSVNEVPCETQVESEVKDLSQKEPINSEIRKESVEAPKLETKHDETPINDKKVEEIAKDDEPIEKIPVSRVSTRKRKISERKSISESDSDNGSQFVSESVSQDPESEVEEAVQRKKPRIRGKITPRRKLPTRHSARVEEASKNVVTETPKVEEKPKENENKEEESKTLQNFKFDYDENEDVAANVAAIKTLICKDTDTKNENDESSEDESVKKKSGRPGRKAKRGRPGAKKIEAQASSSEDEDAKSSSKMPDSKRSKTSESNEPSPKEPVTKKREKKKGLLRDLDTSLVIETVDNEAPVRASRRIAQQKIKEETDRRLMEERLLKQMKEDAEKKKKNVSLPPGDDEKDSDSDDSYKGESKKKRKKKMKPTDPSKPWQTSSSHSEHSESEIEEYEHHEEDPGSPLFRSDHEFSPESEDDSTPVQPVKRARTAKKQVEESSSDEEDVNPNHACQVCHKTDSPEWILLCDGCDCGYHCSCLKPIIFCIPSGNWYCPLCCHKKLISDLGVQLEKLDILVETIQVEEIRKQKQIEAQKLTEISEQNILNDRRKNRAGETRRRKNIDDDKESSQNEQSSENDESESNDDSSSSDNSSDNAPLIYKLRKRNQATASYRFNDYDDLINSAIRDEMEEVKGLGNAGRGKDISTIIEADKEEKKQQRLEKERGAGIGEKKMPSEDEEKADDGESSGSEVARNKKSIQRKKKMRKLNALEDTSEEENSDDDFKGSSSSNSDTEEYSASSVSESSLDLPRKKGKAAQRSTRSAARNRRYDEKFINDQSSDDEPLIKKRNKKKSSDEEDYDVDEDDGSGSTAEEVDSSDLCDDTETDSSEDNFPRKKKRVASYDRKPRKPAKKFDEDDDKAFRAGISKKKILERKQEENESEGSGSEKATGRRKTRGKKLLYIMEDDFESDDGIKPGVGVVRPETPPEEREMFRKKQEEIKKMLAAKNTEGAKKLAVPTIEPLSFDIEKPKSPSPPPIAESSSLSTIPKDVIQGAKALDFDFNRIKPVHHSTSKANELQPEMSEEELAKMMEEEDFAQHQLKLAGEAIRKQQAILELEGKEEAFSAFSKKKDDKPLDVPIEPKKRAKKPKVEKALNEPVKAPIAEIPKAIPEQLIRPPHTIPQTQSLHSNHPMSSVPPPLISNIHHQPPLHAPYSNLPPTSRFALNPNQPLPPHNLQERPSVLSSLMAGHPRPEMHPQFHRQLPPEGFMQKGPPHLPPAHLQQQIQPLPSQAIAEDKEKKGRRKKFTPLRQDLPEANVPKVAKLDTPPTTSTTSVIHTNMPVVDDKNKGLPPALQRTGKAAIAVASPPQIFNPGTSPTPSVITRLIQPPPQNSPQQRIGPYGFSEHDNVPSSQPPPSSRAYPSTDEIKHLAAASAAASKQSRPSPQAPFNENPFVPRTMHHTLYRAPPTSQSIYGIPPHARLPYPFHLPPHPNNNLRPQDYASSPYGIPPQFAAYYGAPPAHRPPNSNSTATPLNHPENFHHPGAQPRVGDPENPQQQATPSEFGGLVSYFSSQQELD